jgi:DNA-binding winged helix-turn-helix (wHTH) protein
MPITTPFVRFGVFELDPGPKQLSKQGRKLRLQEQPFLLLSLLLECPGELISREKLREALWPADTFVDFDHSLNAAIAKMRR